jgi:divalent metal cation (Fe/Co/Zn/Cd) transporter
VRQIRSVAESVEGVLAVEKLWVRKTGLEYLADIHVQVDAQITVDEGHRIGHFVKDRLLAEFTSLRDVLVHLEPHGSGPAATEPAAPQGNRSSALHA